MPENTQEMITVACPECGEHNFTFSKNAINPKSGINFTCSHCCFTTYIKLDRDGSISVECVG